jgi:hypothetical protein
MNTVPDKIEEEVLIRLLLERQPHSMGVLDLLRRRFANNGGRGAFAPIKGYRCGACNLSIAHARLQSAKNGAFIACGNCSRFLYWPEAVLVENNPTESE